VNGADPSTMTFAQLYDAVLREQSDTKPKISEANTSLGKFVARLTGDQTAVTGMLSQLTRWWEGKAPPVFISQFNSHLNQVSPLIDKITAAQKNMQDVVGFIDTTKAHLDNIGHAKVDVEAAIPPGDTKGMALAEQEFRDQAWERIRPLMDHYAILARSVSDVAAEKWNGPQSAERPTAPGTNGPAGTAPHAPGGGPVNPSAAKPPVMPKQAAAQNASNQTAANNGNSAANSPAASTSSPMANTPTDSGSPTDPGTGSTPQPADTVPTLAGGLTPTADIPTATQLPLDTTPFTSTPTVNPSPPLNIPPPVPIKTIPFNDAVPSPGLLGSSAPASPASTQLSRNVNAAAQEPTLAGPGAARVQTAASGPAGFYPPMGGMGGMGAGAGKQGGAGVKPGVAQNPGGPKVGQPGASGKRKPKNVGIPPDLLGREGEQRSADRPANPSTRRRPKPKAVPSEVLDEELWNVDAPATSGR
jgi:hypothetical protein